MVQTDLIRWPEKLRWETKGIKGGSYFWEEATHGPLHLAWHPGNFMRVELAWGPGSQFQHTLLSMQVQSNWGAGTDSAKEVTVAKIRKALTAMGLVEPAALPKIESL